MAVNWLSQPASANGTSQTRMSINGLSQARLTATINNNNMDPPPRPRPRPPPASQSSYFAKFANFQPDEKAPFEDEFARLASSQQLVPGSREYTRERTIAMRQEMTMHYFSQPQPQIQEEANESHVSDTLTTKEVGYISQDEEIELTEAQILKGYQDLCTEVGLLPGDCIQDCKQRLKATLVNIIDLIDARRTKKPVKVWEDFTAFRAYTLQPEHRIDVREAKAPPGFLRCLLQKLGSTGARKLTVKRDNGNGLRSGKRVVSGRVNKKNRD